MMRSLTRVESVVSEFCSECGHGFWDKPEDAFAFAPPPDAGAAERFNAAMDGGGASLPDVSPSVRSGKSAGNQQSQCMFDAVANTVADAIVPSPEFAKGEGRMLVRLPSCVLDGSEIQIAVKGCSMAVVVDAATQDALNAVSADLNRFETSLAKKFHSWRVSVAVRRGGKADERS